MLRWGSTSAGRVLDIRYKFMKQKLSKKAIYWLGVIAVGIALGLALQFVRAWTEPTAAPPGGNLGAPLNTGPQKQVKQGDICTTVTGSEICLSAAGSGGGGGCTCQIVDGGGAGSWLYTNCSASGESTSWPVGTYPCGTIVPGGEGRRYACIDDKSNNIRCWILQ
jgi:hypothetical protein